MAQDYGVTTLGTTGGEDEILASAVWDPMTKAITVKSGEGVLAAGTLVMLDEGTGKYVKHAGATSLAAGYLNEEVDATDEDVKTYLCFNAEVNVLALFSASTISTGFFSTSMLNIKEAK